MQQASVVTVYLGDDLVFLAQAGFIRLVVAQSPGSWLFTGAATCEDVHPHGFTRVIGLPGMHTVAQEHTTHRRDLKLGPWFPTLLPQSLLTDPQVLVTQRFWGTEGWWI